METISRLGFQIRSSEKEIRSFEEVTEAMEDGGDGDYGRWRLWRMEAATERRVFEDGGDGYIWRTMDTLIIIQYDLF